jgi:hypothetical protein
MFESIKSASPFGHSRVLSYFPISFGVDIRTNSEEIDYIDTRLDQLYAYLFEMAGIYELSACAIALEKELQGVFLRLLGEGKELQPALLLWQKKYDVANDPIKKAAAIFDDRLIDEILNYKKTGDYSPALKMLRQHFPMSVPGRQIFQAFNSDLESYLDYAIFQQVRFISLYAQSPTLFAEQRAPLIRSLGLSALLKETRIRKIDSQVAEMKKEGAIGMIFNLDDLREESIRDLSWIKPRDSAFLLNMSKGKWTPEALKRFGIDINQAFQRVSENLRDRKLSQGAALNYIAFVQMSIDALTPDSREMAVKNAAHVLSRLIYSNSSSEYGVFDLARIVLASEALDDADKIGAHLHLSFMENNCQTLTVDKKLHPALKAIIKEVSPNPKMELEAYCIFGIADAGGKRLSRMKRGAISEDMGL